jgi:cation:H+ antiporter
LFKADKQFSLILISPVLLYFGASWLIKGSSSLAIKAGISLLVTGLTIVSFGTASPALIVSINAVISGHGNMVIGNVIGSNLFNICIILGISAMVAPIKIKIKLLKIDIPSLVLSAIGFMILFSDRQINRFEGGILLFGFALYTGLKIILSHREKNTEIHTEFKKSIPDHKLKWYYSAGMAVLGIGLMFTGAELLLKGAVATARLLGVGDTIISLTIVAGVTSMPLLVTTIVSIRKKEYDVAIVTVISSGIFNILGIIGVSSLINPLSAIAISNIDLYVMLGITLLLLPFFRSSYTLKRDEGIFMIGIYLIYMYYLWPK